MDHKRINSSVKYHQISTKSSVPSSGTSPPDSLVDHCHYERLSTTEDDELIMVTGGISGVPRTISERKPLLGVGSAFASYSLGPKSRGVKGPVASAFYPSLSDSGFDGSGIGSANGGVGGGGGGLSVNNAKLRYKVFTISITLFVYLLLPSTCFAIAHCFCC